MILGNSGGKNKGKKYLDRGNLDYTKLTGEDYSRLDEFNTWYTDNIELLECELRNKNVLDKDVLGDTYANICESILFTKLEIADFKGYFSRAYCTNYIQNRMKEARYTEAKPYSVENIVPETYEDEQAEKEYIEQKETLIKEILLYVKQQLSDYEYRVFEKYITQQPRENYFKLSERLNVRHHHIQKIVSKAKKLIQENKDFKQRRISIN